MEQFGVTGMAEIWRMYCGLTKLEHVDLVSLSASLSQPSIDKLDWDFTSNVIDVHMSNFGCKDIKVAIIPMFMNERKPRFNILPYYAGNLVMMSLYEAQDESVSNQVLQALFKSTIRTDIRSPYVSHVVAYAISQHPSLQKVHLTFKDRSDLSESDLKPLNESIRNLKVIELRDPPVETVLSALSGQVEEFSLTSNMVCYPLLCMSV
jgi:hypothetical protein